MGERFDAEAIRRLATLARLTLDDDRAEALAADLSRITAYVEQFASLEGDFDAFRGAVARRPDREVDAPPAAMSAALVNASAGATGPMITVPLAVTGTGRTPGPGHEAVKP